MKLVPQSRFRLIRMSRLLCLIALAIALDGDGIKFGLGDDGNLGMEVDARIENDIGDKKIKYTRNNIVDKTYSPVITTSGD